MFLCVTDDYVMGGHSFDPHENCVDEHMNYRCDSVMSTRWYSSFEDLESEIQAECMEVKRLQK